MVSGIEVKMVLVIASIILWVLINVLGAALAAREEGSMDKGLLIAIVVLFNVVMGCFSLPLFKFIFSLEI